MRSDDYWRGFEQGMALVLAAVFVGVVAALVHGCAPADTCTPMPNPDTVYEDTSKAWEASVGPLPSDVAFITVVTSQVTAGDFDDRCRTSEGQVVGCSWYVPIESTHYVQVLECHADIAATLRHEYAHVLAKAVDGDGDGEHERDDIWGPVAARREIEK